ncbi:MAG: DUF4388 domain-containing protein [Polyangiales bacterium]
MTRPRIAVLTANEADSHARALAWEKLAPVDFVPMQSPKELGRDLQRQRFDAIVVDHGYTTALGEPLWAELAAEYPTMPIAVLSAPAPLPVIENRAVSVSSVASDEQVADFLSAEVLSVTRGRLSGVSLPSVLQVLQMEQRTCRLRVRSAALLGELFVRNGALVHASLRKLSPMDAALELLTWTDADVVFDRFPAGTAHSIDGPLDFLMMEAARLRDERVAAGLFEPMRSTSPLNANTESWLVPAVLRGDADALLSEVMSISGSTAAAVVDFDNRLLVALRTRKNDAIPRIHGTISDAMHAIATLLADMKLRSATEDILVTVGSAYILLRPLRAMPTLVLFAAFDREIATLGLLRAQVSRLAQDFGSKPS